MGATTWYAGGMAAVDRVRWGVSRRRQGVGFATAAGLLAVVTAVMSWLRDEVALPGDVAVYLLVVIVIGVVGGFLPALCCAMVAGLLFNYFLVPPLHTLLVDRPDNVVALVVFVVAGVLVSRVVDVSARRALQVARSQAREEALLQAEQTRTALLGAVSHDLRTPIAAAKAAVSGLRSTEVTWSDADRAELLTTADTALDRLTDLITNLLDLSRLQAGVLPVRSDVVGLDDAVAGALAHLDGSGTVRVDLPDDLPAVVADGGLLERVVANLVQNALRFAPPDVPVVVRGGTAGPLVQLFIVDRGRGIPDADRDRVFAPFQRLGDTPVDGAGVGLGLAIVRGFVQAMGGTVVAAPTPGGGATLVVSLPAAPEVRSGS